ncbi:nicotinate-nucleotide adenylyltransferase [Herbaspirillum sp. RTI4]|uniref:nicotinate-nucleotide adenylyltransferase n=1 Tax=Herbaspirillum sp. RTI4 TaxID=3048640 RepID=UPI002AB3F170|nr:nicotinate-nucleotide adenylyltransferase [Herbaspirillum sp. RTI4]MDY7580008.1 nicotinate-nucleotide adenylyltransferase [Herbaspirillum sp. RTI4]MEA9982822.1 nicotinate-nucleotide adenylyltransferase [Herbaspirillum sp. RTI4]
MTAPSASRCIAILGGSFDPVHNGHVALAQYFVDLLHPDELHVLPAGNPWQKHGLQASAADRVEMVRRAFDNQKVPVVIDEQEILRSTATFTIDTLRALREELGPDVSIVFLMGADQLQHLNTWQGWRQLFDYAHLCAASRPGFGMGAAHVPQEVAQEFASRNATPQQIASHSHGLTCLASNLAVDISSTAIRASLHNGERPDVLIPARVLDYIEQHHLYQS